MRWRRAGQIRKGATESRTLEISQPSKILSMMSESKPVIIFHVITRDSPPIQTAKCELVLRILIVYEKVLVNCAVEKKSGSWISLEKIMTVWKKSRLDDYDRWTIRAFPRETWKMPYSDQNVKCNIPRPGKLSNSLSFAFNLPIMLCHSKQSQ